MKLDQLLSIEGKIAVVTGGSRGIGEMITAGFLANGVKVYITARKAGPLIDKARELSDQYGQECIAIPSDLSSHGGIVEFADGSRYLMNRNCWDLAYPIGEWPKKESNPIGSHPDWEDYKADHIVGNEDNWDEESEWNVFCADRNID